MLNTYILSNFICPSLRGSTVSESPDPLSDPLQKLRSEFLAGAMCQGTVCAKQRQVNVWPKTMPTAGVPFARGVGVGNGLWGVGQVHAFPWNP